MASFLFISLMQDKREIKMKHTHGVNAKKLVKNVDNNLNQKIKFTAIKILLKYFLKYEFQFLLIYFSVFGYVLVHIYREKEKEKDEHIVVYSL